MKQKQQKQKNTISPEQNTVRLFRDKNTYFVINDDADVLAKVYCVDIQQVLGARRAIFPANELDAVLNALVRNQHRVALYKFMD